VRRLVALGIAGLLCAVSVSASPAAGSKATNVTVEQARKLIQERGGKADFLVLDVRTPAEFAEWHLTGALNMDVQTRDFETQVGSLDRRNTFLVYCRSGNRSTKAVQTMERMGFQSVYHMTEGVIGWEKK
jgi:rhodanese-related sulfurtransferase